MAQAENEKTYDISAEKYFKAISDYESYPKHVDGMKKVSVQRNGGEITAQYELSMMSKDMTYSLKIKENQAAGELSWVLLESEFFKVNNGAWKIESTGPDSCKVHYSLEVEFTFGVPGFILKPMVKSTLPTMMDGFYNWAKKQ